jgi:hypothetical protein
MNAWVWKFNLLPGNVEDFVAAIDSGIPIL